MENISKKELKLFNILARTFGVRKAIKLMRLFYDICFWFKYKPCIFKLQLTNSITKIKILIIKLQIKIYDYLLKRVK